MTKPPENSDQADVYYTVPQRGRTKDHKPNWDLTQAVAVKYLVLNGQKVVDPNKGSNSNGIYTKLKPDGTVDKKSEIKNPNNYLVVPANYDPAEADAFAAKVNAAIAASAKNQKVMDSLLVTQ